MNALPPFAARCTPWAQAFLFADACHAGQLRDDGRTPYITHPVAVAALLVEHDVLDLECVTAALLHDVIEDTDATHGDIVERFGRTVADLVLEVSDDKSLPKAERKAAQVAKHWSPRASLIKIADKTANLRDIVELRPSNWTHSKKIGYYAHAKLVVEGMRNTHPGLRASFMKQYHSGLSSLF